MSALSRQILPSYRHKANEYRPPGAHGQCDASGNTPATRVIFPADATPGEQPDHGLTTDAPPLEMAEGQFTWQVLSASLLDEMPAFVFTLGNDHRFGFINKEFHRVFGEPGDRRCFEVLFGEQAPCRVCRAKTLCGECSVTGFSCPLGVQSYRIEIRSFPLSDGARIVMGYGQDITETRLMEEELRRHARKIREMSLTLARTTEQERGRLALELHDGPLQLLALARLQTQLLIDRTGDDRASTILDNLDGCIKELRQLTAERNPQKTEDDDLMQSLQLLADEMKKRHGLRVALQAHIPPISPWAASFLFRACREFLVNAIKHGCADAATVRIHADRASLHLEVEDNGRGFSCHPLFSDTGCNLGLVGIRRRCMDLSGGLSIHPDMTRGALVRLFLPLDMIRTDPVP